MVSQRILVVDDDRSACAAVSRMLTGEGYSVDTAENGEAALAAMRHADYDLAILDYQMPGMDGVELCQKMREMKPEIPAVFVTAFTTIDKVFPAFSAGAERVLAKPVDIHELVPVVQELIGKP
ncbi:MAG: response regulator [Planctomycetaceae bacterium]|nr:response regulator [Planctomycetaceae bacterium]